MEDPSKSIDSAYAYCLCRARAHYENFPVASVALPAYLRRPIAVIYTFARNADDFADEGNAPPEQRLNLLKDYGEKLTACVNGSSDEDPVFIALADVIRRHALPAQLLHDLLTAFTMDVTTHRYATFDEVLFYCRHSANPIGRLLLHLSDTASEVNLQQADAVCTSLQLINFWQDIGQDYDENNRIYVPTEDMERFKIVDSHFANKVTDASMRALMDFQIRRARQIMARGAPLGKTLRGRLGFELRLTIETGLSILASLQRHPENAFARPRLRKRDWIRSVWRAM